MKKCSLFTVVFALILAFCSTAFGAPLPEGTLLTFDLGNSPSPVTSCNAGSCFSMETSPNFFLYTNIESCQGITLGFLQPGGGTHPGPPTGIEPCGVDKAWSFFGNTGMHQIIGIPVTDNGDGTLDFRGWSVTWNGIPDIPMGGDPVNFPADTGAAPITISGNNYTLDYSAHVPIGSPSGFGGVPYALHLEGTVIHVDSWCVDPLICDDNDLCTADTCIDNPDGTYSCFNEPLICDDLNPCTDDSCDPATGVCVFLPNSDPTCDCVPEPEVCDGLDNDCNEIVDDIPCIPTTCGIGECAMSGCMECVGTNLVDSCEPGSPNPEVCDGLDNDCDGVVDNGIAPAPTICGVGECASTGEMICQNGTMIDTCVPGTPSAEVCDGLDNDCNGLVDDGIPYQWPYCDPGPCGPCTSNADCPDGTVCNASDICLISCSCPMCTVCAGFCVPANCSAEVCDGLDNDCDGLIDEDIPPVTTTCGVGECASTGEMICENGIMIDTCVPGQPSSEVCDGLDNDCDGAIDEDVPPEVCCGAGECHACATVLCQDGQPVDTCVPGTPAVEGPDGDPTCADGLDNDCDGLTDASDFDCSPNLGNSVTIRGGGQRPTTVDLQIQTEFTVLNDGNIVDSSASTITVMSGAVLGFNCKVGNGPDPNYGELDGVPLSIDSVGVVVCDEEITGLDTHKLYLTNKGNGGKDTDRMTIKIVK